MYIWPSALKDSVNRSSKWREIPWML